MARLLYYPETVQFRHTVDHVAKHMISLDENEVEKLPTLKFNGTIKLHGSNAAIAYQKNIGHWCQSRNHVITPIKDHAGFATHMDPLAENFFVEHVLPHCRTIQEYYQRNSVIIMYGEWCGGRIQGDANVGIGDLPEMFVIFKIKIISQSKISNKSEANNDDEYKKNRDGFWLDPQEWTKVKWHERSIYNIYDFRTYDIEINFDTPELSQDILTQITEEVERQCPVAAYFNKFGVGEGVVWTEWKETHGTLSFKVKGRKHSVIKFQTMVPVHTPNINRIQDFVEYACTKNRMQQTYDSIYEELGSISGKDFSAFVRWLAEDIIKEEKDIMDQANIKPKDVSHAITSKAQSWFDNHLAQHYKGKTKQKRS